MRPAAWFPHEADIADPLAARTITQPQIRASGRPRTARLCCTKAALYPMSYGGMSLITARPGGAVEGTLD